MAAEPDGNCALLHATAIAVGAKAVLIRGPSGAGKSDLALRCLALAPFSLLPERPRLLADDQVMIERRGDALHAEAPASIRGRLEVRGLGILSVESAPAAEIVLIADIGTPEPQDRYPDPWPCAEILGLRVPRMALDAQYPSAALKLMIALHNPDLPPVCAAR